MFIVKTVVRMIRAEKEEFSCPGGKAGAERRLSVDSREPFEVFGKEDSSIYQVRTALSSRSFPSILPGVENFLQGSLSDRL
jgi:hypothetical protein